MWAVARCKALFAEEKSSRSQAGGESAKNWAPWQITETQNEEDGKVKQEERWKGLFFRLHTHKHCIPFFFQMIQVYDWMAQASLILTPVFKFAL